MNSSHLPKLPFQVSELLARIHHQLDLEFGAVQVEGEVSGLTQARSGHRYFSLKDLDGQLRCAWFRNSFRGQTIREGQKIIAHGRLAIYTPRGDLQFIVQSVEDSGEGALAAAFQHLKKKLEAEGLFDPSTKRPLPALIRRLAIISSPQAAALQDVLVTLGRRDPFIEVELYPVPVQGETAATEITKALRSLPTDQSFDVVLLTRGGGSLEDLQAFNDEVLARAIAHSSLPVVSAIGHETDFSISDFVASLRAATPTAAAELLSKDRSAQAATLPQLRNRLHRALECRLEDAEAKLVTLTQRLQRQSPVRRLDNQAQRLDGVTRRLERIAVRQLQSAERSYKSLHFRLIQSAPTRKLERQQYTFSEVRQRLLDSLARQLHERSHRLEELQLRLKNLGPEQVLKRGYTIVRQQGVVVAHARNLQADLRASIQWSDGIRGAIPSKKSDPM